MTQTQQKKTPGLAIGALVCGILSLVPPLCLVAIILGIIALNKIKNDKENLKGSGMAITGIVMGAATILLLPVIAMLAAIAIPNLLRARANANATMVVTSMYTIAAAEETYYYDNDTYATLQRLAEADPPYIDSLLGSGLKYEANFNIVVSENNFYVTAFSSTDTSSIGSSAYYIDEDNVLCKNNPYATVSIDMIAHVDEGCPPDFEEVQKGTYY